MALLVKFDKYGTINRDETTTKAYYVINFISESYTLQNNTTIDGRNITAGELFVKAKYLCYMQDSTKCYWGQHPLKHYIIVPTITKIDPHLDFFGITYVQDISKSVCNRI